LIVDADEKRLMTTLIAHPDTVPAAAAHVAAPWACLVRLSAAQLVAWGALYYTFAVVQVPMMRDLGWSQTLLAGAFSLTLLVYALAGPVLGPLFDRRGPWGTMVAGASGGALLLACWAWTSDPLFYVLVMGALGLAMAACLYEPAFYLVASWFPARRAKALTVLTLFGALASPLFMPLTERLCLWLGWRSALLVLAGGVLLIVVPLLASLPRVRPTALSVRPSDASTTRSVLRERRFWWLQAGFILVSVTTIAVPVHLVPYLVAQGESLAFAAACAGCIALVGVAGRLVFGLLGDGPWLIVLTVAVFALMTVAVILLLVIPGKAGAIIFTIGFGLGYGALWPTRAALVARAWSGPSLGAIAGVFAFGPNLAKAAAPLLAAVIALGIGMDGAFAVLAALPAIGAWLIWQGRW
jgi:MFS family permease